MKAITSVWIGKKCYLDYVTIQSTNTIDAAQYQQAECSDFDGLMVVAKACKDEHTYQKGYRGEPAKSSPMTNLVSLSKIKFQLLGSNVRKNLP